MNVGRNGTGLKSKTTRSSANQPDFLSSALFAFMLLAAGAFGVWAGARLHSPSALTLRISRAFKPVEPLHSPLPNSSNSNVPGPVGTWTDLPANLKNPNVPVTISRMRKNAVSMILITGGIAGTRRMPTRHEVSDFVRESGATAGLNGTFFANASLYGTDNKLIGPSICGDEAELVVGPFDHRPALRNRPLVLMSTTQTMIVPYDPNTMDDYLDLKNIMPTLSDAFLGGVWLVHDGVAANSRRMASYHVKDANDYRRRAFFAVMMDGRPALGATDCSVSSLQLSKALQMSGVREAVLLDSGFSTSLVYQNNILVSGHSTKAIPSRPIPHAILLFGDPAASAKTASALGSSRRNRLIAD